MKDDKIEALIQANPFMKMLAQIRAGGAVTEATEKIGELIGAVKRTGSKGKMTITLELTPDDKGEVRGVEIDAEVKIKAPERKRKKTFFYVVGEQSLSRTGTVEDQPEFDFDARPAAAPAGSVRKLSAADLKTAAGN
jgi:hypothetical protein